MKNSNDWFVDEFYYIKMSIFILYDIILYHNAVTFVTDIFNIGITEDIHKDSHASILFAIGTSLFGVIIFSQVRYNNRF